MKRPSVQLSPLHRPALHRPSVLRQSVTRSTLKLGGWLAAIAAVVVLALGVLFAGVHNTGSFAARDGRPSGPSGSAAATERSTSSLWPLPTYSPASQVAPSDAVPSPTPPIHLASGPTPPALGAGNWQTITWYPISDQFGCGADVEACGRGIFGYSGGYIVFESTYVDEIVSSVPLVSRDGVSWRAGKPLDLTDVGGEIVQVAEGPKGLLAVARSGATGLCGSYPIWIQGLWTSRDGLNWTEVNLRTAFGGAAVYDVAAGPSGYIADGVATDGATTIVWTSADGRNWTPSPLPAELTTVATVDNIVSFSGGFVLEAEDFAGCGTLPLTTNSLWWSADGSSWTRSDFPASSPSMKIATSVYRESPGTLVAVGRTTRDGKILGNAFWISHDGKTWAQTAGPAISGDLASMFAGGNRSIYASWGSEYWQVQETSQIVAVNPDGSIVELRQSGAAPALGLGNGSGFGYVPVPNVAFGPAGLMVLDGRGLFLGVPA